MYIRSARKRDTGKFTVTCWDQKGEVFFTAEFDDMNVATEAGQDAERRMVAKAQGQLK